MNLNISEVQRTFKQCAALIKISATDANCYAKQAKVSAITFPTFPTKNQKFPRKLLQVKIKAVHLQYTIKVVHVRCCNY